MKVPENHPHKQNYFMEVDPNLQRTKQTITRAYLLRSKARLEVLAGRPLKTKESVIEALNAFKHALLDKQIKAISDHWGEL